jgi:lambda family phage portal protein
MKILDRARAIFKRPPKTIATRAYAGGSGFEAAGAGRRFRGSGVIPNLQSAELASREQVARSARYAAANMPLAVSAADVWVSEAVGSGCRPVPSTGDEALDAIILAAWDSWCNRADYFGLTSFEGLQAMAARREFVDGEGFFLLVIDRDELKIKALDPAQVNPAMSMLLPGGGLIISGIEVDLGGRPVAAHVFKDWIPGLPLLRGLLSVRIPIEDIVHLYRPEAAGQARGMSRLASVLLRLQELDGLTDGQLMRQRIGALLTGFITDADGTLLDERSHLGEVSLEPGTMQRLRPGESVTWSDPPEIGTEANEFQKAIVREVASGAGIPPFLVDGNMGEVNFSSARVALIAFRRRIEQWQSQVLEHQFLRPVYRRWLSVEILSGRIADVALNEATLKHKWISPKGVWVDPLKDAQAESLAISAGLTSRRECVAARGIDIEQLDSEIAQDRAREKALGIDFTPIAQTPQKQLEEQA